MNNIIKYAALALALASAARADQQGLRTTKYTSLFNGPQALATGGISTSDPIAVNASESASILFKIEGLPSGDDVTILPLVDIGKDTLVPSDYVPRAVPSTLGGTITVTGDGTPVIYKAAPLVIPNGMRNVYLYIDTDTTTPSNVTIDIVGSAQ